MRSSIFVPSRPKFSFLSFQSLSFSQCFSTEKALCLCYFLTSLSCAVMLNFTHLLWNFFITSLYRLARNPLENALNACTLFGFCHHPTTILPCGMPLWLSQYRVFFSYFWPSSSMNFFIHSNSLFALVMTIYSTSVVDKATHFYSLDWHDITPLELAIK